MAFKDLVAELSMSFTDIQWVLDAYATSMAAVLLLSGLLADRFGPRPTVIAGATIFAITSILASAAAGPGTMIFARSIQGVGAAALLASIPVLIVQNLPVERRMIGFAVFGGASGVALASGPLIGGQLLAYSWRWIFWINIPAMMIVVLAVLAVRSVKAGTRGVWGPVITSLVLGGAMFAFVYILTHVSDLGPADETVVLAAIATAVCVAGFVFLQRSTAFRLFDLGRFRGRTLLSLNVVTLIVNLAVFPLILLSVVFLEVVQGYSAISTGVRLLVLTGALFVGSVLAAPLKAKVGPIYCLTVSLVILFIGLVALAPLAAEDQWTAVVPGFILAGLGFGLFNPIRAENTVALVPESDAGLASGIGNSLQELGVGCGVALLGSVFIVHIERALGIDLSNSGFGAVAVRPDFREAFAEAWTLTVGISAVSVALAVLIWSAGARRFEFLNISNGSTDGNNHTQDIAPKSSANEQLS